MKKLVGTLLVSCSVLCWAAAESVNLLENGGFEEWQPATGELRNTTAKDNLVPVWNRGGVEDERQVEPKAHFERDAAVKHSGEYALKIFNENPGSIVKVLRYDIPVKGGTKYRFSGWIRGQGIEIPPQGHGFWFGFSAGGKKTFWQDNKGILKTQKLTGDFDWQKFETEVTTREGDELGMIQVQLRLAKGVWWVDDLVLEEVE